MAALLQMKAAQKGLKARFRTQARPDRIDFEINQSGSRPPVAILKRVESRGISAERGIRLR